MTEPLTDEERAPWTDTELQLEQQALAEKREEWLAETNRQKRDLLRDILVFATRAFATIAVDRKRVEAAEELIATMEGYPGEAHGADEWYCERMEKDIAAYRKAYPAKKGGVR